MMEAFESCSSDAKKGIWVHIGKQMSWTGVQVHDYFYNTWQLQFFDSPDFGIEELKEMYLLSHNPNLSIKDNIKTASDMFKRAHP